MDIWQSGRKELFDELSKICDRVGVNLAAELDHENSALIQRDKLRALREQAAKADELEDEVSSLVRQKRVQDTKLSELGTLQDKNTENNRLVDDNARLAEELETHKTAALRVDELEKENKRLAAELKQTLGRARRVETPGRLLGSDGPVSTDPPSSVLRTEGDQSGTVAKNAYESLVRKYNKLYENHVDITSAREQLQRALNSKKDDMKKYQEYYDHLENKVKKRNTRIEEQDQELRRLRVQIREVSGESRMLLGLEISPELVSRQEHEAWNLEEAAMALNSASLGPIHYDGKVTTFDDIVKIINSPTLNEIVATAQRMRASTRSPVKHGVNAYSTNLVSTSLGSSQASKPLHVSEASGENQNERSRVDQLPMLLPNGNNGIDERVVETEFEALEFGHTSSTDGATHYTSPEKLVAPEIKPEPPMDTPTSPDTPVVISSRSVKKRKGRNDATQHNDTPRVKIETISSSPVGLAVLYGLDESIDLDDIGEKQTTPRKGRPFLEKALRTSSLLAKAARSGSQSQDHSQSCCPNDSNQVSQATPIHRTGVSRTGFALQPRSANKQILPRTSVERAPKRRRITSAKAVGDLIEDGQVVQSVEKSPQKLNTPTPKQARLLGDLLAKASPPKQVLKSPACLKSIQSKSRLSGGGESAVLSRAYEVRRDNTPDTATFGPPLSKGYTRSKEPAESSGPVSRERVRKSVEALRPSSKGSIRNSLELPRPPSRDTFRDSAYFSRPTSRDSPVGYLGASKPPRPPSRDSRHGFTESERPSSGGTNRQFKASASVPKAAQSRLREQTALRTRPLNELTLQDFKVNPKYNQGYDYAFNDVVRNQAERRCLQGCTKSDCCGGKFRALAEATRNPHQPLTSSQEEADDKTLKDFLGDNSYKLRNMTKDEREETLIQARAREMSNKYGKHRHAYERRTSPPGYWRSDFPTTQEEIQDRAKAQQLERDQISQRYEAAMRPGGAYIFRDE